MQRTYKLITNTTSLSSMIYDLQQYDILAVDTETDGLHNSRQPVGISLSGDETVGYYIPLQLWSAAGLTSPWKPEAIAYIKEQIRDLLLSKKLVLHNAIFDVKVFENWAGFNILPNIHCDTQLLAHTVYNEEGPLGLKKLAAELIEPDAANPQLDVKESVIANGGQATKANFEMWKCDYKILGKYACYDAMYCLALYNKLYPEIDKQGLRKLWEEEVHALIPITYELNNTGLRVDVEHFKKMKIECEQNIAKIEESIYSQIKDAAYSYELDKTIQAVKVTPRSQCGRYLIGLGLDINNLDSPEVQEAIVKWAKENDKYCHLNLDSGDDKAFLLYHILNLPCEKYTKSQKPATDKATLDELSEKYEASSPVLKALTQRSKERKLLNSYVLPILEDASETSWMYAGFNQTATVSGRYSSSGTINFQTLPRDDKRIKSGFVAPEGMAYVAMDYESAEPKIFAHVSGDYRLQDIFTRGHDFYSTIVIATEGCTEYSPDPKAENYLGKLAKSLRQKGKAYSLGVPYGQGGFKLGTILKIPTEEAQKLVDSYLAAYPDLYQWMLSSEEMAMNYGYVISEMGRKRRLKLVHTLCQKFKITEFTRQNLSYFYKKYNKLSWVNEYETVGEFAYACKNELNNAKNFQIQSMAASVCNRAMIRFYNEVRARGLNAKLTLQIHDEIVVTCPVEQANEVAALLKDCMLNNSATALLSVRMTGEPVITTKSLAEAK